MSVDLKQQVELGRLLADATGYAVRTVDGTELGQLEHVRYEAHADRPDEIAVRRRWFWQRSMIVPFDAVTAIDRKARTITVRIDS